MAAKGKRTKAEEPTWEEFWSLKKQIFLVAPVMETFVLMYGTYTVYASSNTTLDERVDCWANLDFFRTLLMPVVQELLPPVVSAMIGFCFSLATGILHLFVLELLLDTIFFVEHFMLHEVKWLYRNVHAHHHSHLYNNVLHTYEQSVLDFVFAIPVATLCCWRLLPPESVFLMYHHYTLKEWNEVNGHSGIHVRGTTFAPAPFLPKLLNIDFTTPAVHGVHHVFFYCNYAKRFSAWDKIFGFHVPFEPLLDDVVGPALPNASPKKQSKAARDLRNKNSSIKNRDRSVTKLAILYTVFALILAVAGDTAFRFSMTASTGMFPSLGQGQMDDTGLSQGKQVPSQLPTGNTSNHAPADETSCAITATNTPLTI